MMLKSAQRGMTYGTPLLVNWINYLGYYEIAGTKSVRDIKEQEVYKGDIPLMTKNALLSLMALKDRC